MIRPKSCTGSTHSRSMPTARLAGHGNYSQAVAVSHVELQAGSPQRGFTFQAVKESELFRSAGKVASEDGAENTSPDNEGTAIAFEVEARGTVALSCSQELGELRQIVLGSCEPRLPDVQLALSQERIGIALRPEGGLLSRHHENAAREI